MLTSMSVLRGKGAISVVLEELSLRRSLPSTMREDIFGSWRPPTRARLHREVEKVTFEWDEVALGHWHAAERY